MYLEKSEEVLKYDRDQLEVEALEKAKKELELRKSGQYHVATILLGLTV